MLNSNVSNSIIIRLSLADNTSALTQVMTRINELGGYVGAIDIVKVEGHTDNVPIRSRKFPSNWELSAARATSIASMLINRIKYPEKSISVNGYADTRPKVSYIDSAGSKLKGRALKKARKINRRVEILLTTPPKSMEESTLLFSEKN